MTQQQSLTVILIVMVAAGLIACTLITFGLKVFPVPGGDSSHFIPPAIMQARGEGLLNPLSPFSPLVDPTGAHRYLQYPPLFSLLLAALMPEATPRAAFLVIGFFSATCILLTAGLLLRWAPRSGMGTPSLQAVTSICALMGSATWLASSQTGRPEILAALLALLLMHVLSRRPGWVEWFAGGVIIGLTGATHLVAGLTLAILMVMILAIWLPTVRALVATVIGGAAALAVFVGVIELGPFATKETLAGVAVRAQMVSMQESSGNPLYYWMTNPGATFLGAAFALFTLTAAARLLRDRGCVRSWPLFGVSGGVFVAFTWWSSIRVPELAYNLQFLAPVVIAATFLVVPSCDTGRRSSFALVLTPVTHLACSIGYLRYILLFGVHLSAGVSLETARTSFREASLTQADRIAVTKSMWVLTEDYRRLSICGSVVGAGSCDGRALVVQQSYSQLTTPPRVEGFGLVVDHFVNLPCEIAGIKLASSVPGFGFAIYSRVDTARVPTPGVIRK